MNPVPAARPRVGRWGTFYPKTYKNWMEQALASLPDAGVSIPAEAQLHVELESIVLKPKTTARLHPRGDVDNYAKGPLDIITKSGRYWHDDDQIVSLLTTKRYAQPGEKPRSIVRIYEA